MGFWDGKENMVQLFGKKIGFVMVKTFKNCKTIQLGLICTFVFYYKNIVLCFHTKNWVITENTTLVHTKGIQFPCSLESAWIAGRKKKHNTPNITQQRRRNVLLSEFGTFLSTLQISLNHGQFTGNLCGIDATEFDGGQRVKKIEFGNVFLSRRREWLGWK